MRFARFIVPSLSALAIVAGAATAQAQEASPTGKGVIGGALLGAELVLSIEAALDVQSAWAYIGGGVAGAAAGGVGGYLLESNTDSARVPMLLLAGGMAFAIPTTVAVLSATAYEPPAGYIQDQPPADEPVADPPRSTGVPPRSSKAPTHRRATARTVRVAKPLPPALVDFEPSRITLSVPAFSLHDVYTQREVATLGVEQATELRVPVVNVLF